MFWILDGQDATTFYQEHFRSLTDSNCDLRRSVWQLTFLSFLLPLPLPPTRRSYICCNCLMWPHGCFLHVPKLRKLRPKDSVYCLSSMGRKFQRFSHSNYCMYLLPLFVKDCLQQRKCICQAKEWVEVVGPSPSFPHGPPTPSLQLD